MITMREPKVVDFTIPLVGKVLKANNLAHQRRKNAKRIKIYAERQKSGLWMVAPIIVVIRKDGKESFPFFLENSIGEETILVHEELAESNIVSLINGQNTCEGILKSGTPQYVVYQEIGVDNEDEVVELYLQLDSGLSKRTLKDYVRVQAQKEGLDQLPRTDTLNVIICNAIALAKSGKREDIPPFEKALLLTRETKEEGDAIARIYEGVKRSGFKHKEVAETVLLSYSLDSEGFYKFWPFVRDGGDGVSSPSQRLHEFLNSIIVEGSNRTVTSNGKRSVGGYTIRYHSRKAWNCFRKGEQMEEIVRENVTLDLPDLI